MRSAGRIAVALSICAAAVLAASAPEHAHAHRKHRAIQTKLAAKIKANRDQAKRLGSGVKAASSVPSNKFTYFVEYGFSGMSCGEDSALTATAVVMDTCISFEIESAKYICSDDGYGLVYYLSPDCSGTPTYEAIATSEQLSTCYNKPVSDDYFADDSEGFDDDDDNNYSSSSMYSCTNTIDYGFANAPAVGVYLDNKCSDLWTAEYFIASRCNENPDTRGDQSVEYTCDSATGLTEVLYSGSTDCSTTGETVDSEPVGTCMTATEDDEFDDDFFTSYSTYGTCDGSTLPQSNKNSGYRQSAAFSAVGVTLLLALFQLFI